ncbi:MAG: pyrroloquinoline quinone biosynthesis protein PqqB [Saprospiraceae bacterium]|nr:pyrroloquinoline quinone biosynthesis protein PqqB [Saprospiraceae bacterium]
MKYGYCLLIGLLLSSSAIAQSDSLPHILVLGVAQDGGYPHIGCRRPCCEATREQPANRQNVVSLALVSPGERKWWLFEATPDLSDQLHLFATLTKGQYNYLPDGIFLTHAHIGHYTGLMELGREAMNTSHVPVYALPKMKAFLTNNGPWSQLVRLQNIDLLELTADSVFRCSGVVQVQPFLVPHRDEYSETAGFRIVTSAKKYLFIPDIDKWAKYEKSIVQVVKNVDIAFLDATFYTAGELPFRNIAEVPHPFVSETMTLFGQEALSERRKVCFIHFNHTNPLMWDPVVRTEVEEKGFSVAVQGSRW